DNCGEVGNACDSDEICSHGYCSESCQTGIEPGTVKEVECVPEGSKKAICVDPMTNPSFCGADDNCKNFSECDVDSQVCNNGVCISICESQGKALCEVSAGETLCIDLMSDPEHCGTCYSNCYSIAPQNAEVAGCEAGKCIYKCLDGYTNCNSDDSEVPLCYNLKSDNKHCGGCGEDYACPFPLICKNEICTYSECESPILCEDNLCQNSDTQCGLNCVNCKTEGHAADGYCNDEGECVITKCTENYNLFEGKCLQPGPEYCVADKASSQPINCTKIPNAVNPGCNTSTGQCIVGVCKTGFHVYNNECEENSNENCGHHGQTCPNGSVGPHILTYECSAGGTCNVAACEDGYQKDGMQCSQCDADLRVFVARDTQVLDSEAVIAQAATIVLHYKKKTDEVDAEGRPRYKVNVSFHKEDSQYNEGPELEHVWVYGDYLHVVTNVKETITLNNGTTKLQEGCVDPDFGKARVFNTDSCAGEGLNNCVQYNIYCNGNYYGWVNNADLNKLEPLVNDLSGVPEC
ncbi:MAG: hypothetical protein J6A01_03905, partial [Proteobacteria bacterium]|nr:hypothetical protein [Pseudomonadota bacterium]